MKKKNINKKEKVNILVEDMLKDIDLSKKDKQKVYGDYKKIINYYLKNNINEEEITRRLKNDQVSKCYKKNNDWYSLDNSSKIYPLSMSSEWMSTYRLSTYLKDKVIPEVLQIALFYTVIRFPLFRTNLHKGFFWHYLDSSNKYYKIVKEEDIPCSPINVSKREKELFRVLYYENRISCEIFQLLCDAYGGTIFLETLVGEYLRLLGNDIKYDEVCLNPKSDINKEELDDMFLKIHPIKQEGNLVEKRAIPLDGKLSNVQPCQVIHFEMDLEKVHELAKNLNASINELLLTYLFLAISYSTSKEGFIKIQVPVNMRKFYQSKTLRNFSLYNTISFTKGDIKGFDELLKKVKNASRYKLSKEVIDGVLYHSVSLVNKLRLMPLFIKRPIASFIYRYFGDPSSTTVFSNLGKINLPDELNNKVEKMDFVLGTTLSNKALFTAVSVNNILTLSITKFTTNTSVENSLYNMLKENDLIIKVTGSDLYENRK